MGEIAVAPLVGAWIETWQKLILRFQFQVAPLVGAWIETEKEISYPHLKNGRSPRGSVD